LAANDCVDLFIIGGGINGVGIARDAAGRGLSVVLVEQSDLASATSSASTKLIHGGLRYLEHFEFRLVRESLMERERLLALAPHIIRPMQFVLPHSDGLRPRWQIRLGLFLYDHIGGRKRLPASRSVRIAGTIFGQSLKPELRSGFAYSDCWVDDSRLVVLNAMDAAQRGAAIHTRMRFVSAHVVGETWHVDCVDTETNEPRSFSARAIVNAAGPWVEDVLRRLRTARTRGQARLVKGSHIVVDRLFEGEHAYLLQTSDGRVVFTIPFQEHYTLIGTTDVPFKGDATNVAISDEEVRYLCNTVNRYFQRSLTAAQVIWSYSGVRSLSDDETSNASKVTRDYTLELTASATPPLLSIFGGKITTYRKLAQKAVDKLSSALKHSSTGWTGDTPLPGGAFADADFAAFLTSVQQRWPFLSSVLSRRLAGAYGTRVENFLGTTQRMQDLGTLFGGGLTQAEVDYLIDSEWAQTSEDVLWRRTKLGLQLHATEHVQLDAYVKSRRASQRRETSTAVEHRY
jgi:glycerol-3-phosphate dehydrogenase